MHPSTPPKKNAEHTLTTLELILLELRNIRAEIALLHGDTKENLRKQGWRKLRQDQTGYDHDEAAGL